MLKVTIDFETRSRANLKKVGAYEYSLDESTIVTCLGIKDNISPKRLDSVRLFKFYAMQRPYRSFDFAFRQTWERYILDPDVVFSAHNAFFEQCIYNNVLVEKLGWPNISPRKWRCTAAKAAAVAIPRSLQVAGEVMGLAIQKDLTGHIAMMKTCKPTAAYNKRLKLELKKRPTPKDLENLAKPRPPTFLTFDADPATWNNLYHYCKVDVLAEELLDDALPDLNEFEQELWFIDQRINFRGVAVDMDAVKKISQIMRDESTTMGKELDTLTMGLVSSGNARAQILEFLKLEGIELPNLKAKTVDEFIASGEMSDDARALLKLRKALSKSSTAKYQKFLELCASDGRARDLFLYHGASTGRWGGKNVQPQNFPRGTIKDTDEAIERIKSCSTEDLKMLYGENLMPLFSSVLRGMFIASPGHELFVEDYNAIETRVLWWVAEHKKGLDLFFQGRDPYREMAAAIYSIPVMDVTEGQRQVGKAAVLGCGYQMGAKKFKSSAADVYRVDVDLSTAKLAVTAYRKLHYPVTELWANYNNACIFAVENPGAKYRVGKVRFWVEKKFLWIELPSKRRLAYKDPSAVWTTIEVKDDNDEVDFTFKTKQLRYWAVDALSKKWVREATYGGKMTENIVSAISRDLLAESIVRAEKAGFQVLMHSHDELVSEAPKGGFGMEEYKNIMETLPAWGRGLPIKTGGWVGPRYKKG